MTRFRALLVCLALCLSTSASARQPTSFPTDRVLTHREQAALVKGWIQKRFDTVLPALMPREGIDMWIIVVARVQRGPGVPIDVAAHDLLRRGGARSSSSTTRRRQAVERSRSAASTTTVSTRSCPTRQRRPVRRPAQARRGEAIRRSSASTSRTRGTTPTASPRTKRSDCSRRSAPTYAARVKSAEMLAVGWLETKLPEEIEAYRHAMKVAHMVIARGVLEQGDHARQDDERRRRLVDASARRRTWASASWFHPSITIQRKGGMPPNRRRPARHSARRHAPHRLRHRLPRLLHRHAAQRVRAAAGRDRRARGTQGRAEGGEPASGSDDAVRDGWSGRATRRWPTRSRRRRRRASCRRSTATRSAITATPPVRRSA